MTGDLNPYLALARRLKEEAYCPVIATWEHYREAVKKAGIDFCPVRPDVDTGDYEFLSRAVDPKNGHQVLIGEVLLSHLRESYRDLLAAARGSDLLITHPLTFAGPLVAEKTGIPWISTVLAPISFFSAYDLPVFPPYPYSKELDVMAPWTGKLFLTFTRLATRHFSEPIRKLRAEIGLPRGKNPFFEGQYSPEMTLGLFSYVMARQMSDWPQNALVTGFLFYDKAPENGAVKSIERLEKFLDSGPPPVVFTLGSSAMAVGDRFYRESIQAAATLGVRAVVLVGKALRNGLVGKLPDNVAVFEYAPHSRLFPRAAAVVHHGGMGTTA